MTPDQLTSYGIEYRKTLEKVLDKIADNHIGMIRIFHFKEEAQKTAIKAAILDFQTEMDKAGQELEKLFQ